MVVCCFLCIPNFGNTDVVQDVGERLGAVHKAAGERELDLGGPLDTCVHAEKIRYGLLRKKNMTSRKQGIKNYTNTICRPSSA